MSPVGIVDCGPSRSSLGKGAQPRSQSLENHMTDTTTVKGPASYFPSIEKKYGQPVQHWLDLLRGREGKHMELVGWPKSEHGMGHGHANALVAHHLAAKGLDAVLTRSSGGTGRQARAAPAHP